MLYARIQRPQFAGPSAGQFGRRNNTDARSRFRGGYRAMSNLCRSVVAVIVDNNEGKFPCIILRSQSTNLLLNRCCFIPCGDNRGYAGPLWRSREPRAIGIEFPGLPEISPHKKQNDPDYENKEGNESQHLEEGYARSSLRIGRRRILFFVSE